MVTKTYKSGYTSGRAVLHGVFVSVLALMAFVLCAPQLALAEETTQTIDGIMTITMFDGGTSGGTGATTTTTMATSSTATGDALMWLVLGVAVLIAGAVYVFIKSRSLAANTGAHASAGTHVDASSKKKTIIVAVVTALIACMCFGMYANKGVAFAKDTLSNIFGSSAVVVDEDGNVLSNAITVVNGEDEAIIVKSIEAPADLSDWNADIANETIESGAVAEGEWDGKTIPATLLEQLKNNDGYAELTFTMNVDDTKTPLDFDEFLVGEGAKDYTYTGQQITPSVTSLVYGDEDFEVTYGENINAGENAGTVTIKGTGDYKAEKTYTFNIEQAELTITGVTVFEKKYDGTTVANPDIVEMATTGIKAGDEDKVAVDVSATYVSDSQTDGTVVGKDKEVTFSYTLSGEKAGNYKVDEVNSTLKGTGNIKPATLTVTVKALDKPYDGMSVANLDTEHMTVDGVFDCDKGQVTVEPEAIFIGSNPTVVGTDKEVYVDYDISGNRGNNYIVDLTTSTVTTTASIYKAIPACPAPTSLTAEEGQTLADVSIPAQVAPVEGTFAWEDASLSVGEAGDTPTFKATFTPNDTANYETVSGIEITLTVTKKIAKKDFAVYSEEGNGVNSLTFYNDKETNIPSAGGTYNKKPVTAVYTDLNSHEWSGKAITSVAVSGQVTAPQSMNYWFQNCKSLTTVDLTGLDTSKVMYMDNLFQGCINLTEVKGLTNVSCSTSMYSMFCDCERLTSIEGIYNWNTRNVGSMGWMFHNCRILDLNLDSCWDVSNVYMYQDFNTDAEFIIAPEWVH